MNAQSDEQMWVGRIGMYGLVNRALQELVEERAGKAMWRKLCAEVGFKARKFEDQIQYPDALTYDLVGAASKHLDTSATDLLRAFGHHWILFTARSHYADLLDDAGEDLESFLHGLNALHTTLAQSMPSLRPPSFGVEETDTGLLVYYASDRSGLAPMVIGLLEGLAEHFGAKAEVCQMTATPHGEEVFSVEVLSD